MAGSKRDRRSPAERLGMKTVPRETAAYAEKARVAEAEKTARLRALRLAKEAADRAATPSARPTQRAGGGSTRPPSRANAVR